MAILLLKAEKTYLANAPSYLLSSLIDYFFITLNPCCNPVWLSYMDPFKMFTSAEQENFLKLL